MTGQCAFPDSPAPVSRQVHSVEQPCVLASDNSKSQVHPQDLIIGLPDLMSPSDSSDDQQVASNPPDPSDPNYVQELRDQLKQQQDALKKAQAALQKAQSQLAKAQAAANMIVELRNGQENELQAVANAYLQTRTNYLNGRATLTALTQAKDAYYNTALGIGMMLTDTNAVYDQSHPEAPPLYQAVAIYADSPTGDSNYEEVATDNYNLIGSPLGNITSNKTAEVNSLTILVGRLQALVNATQALIDAATGQPPSQSSDAISPDPNAQAADANAAIDAGSSYDGGGD